MGSKTVTLQQIALEAGVSAVTVSNILNGKNKELWPSTLLRAEKVREIAARLGYRTHGAAKAIATGRFNTIALMMSNSPYVSNLPMRLLWGIQEEAVRCDLHLLLSRISASNQNSDEAIPRILRECMADGLLLDYTHCIPSSLTTLVEKQNIPTIWLNVKQKFNSVYPDDYEAGYQLGKHLGSLGHKSVGYVSYVDGPPTPVHHYSTFDRRLGLSDAISLTKGTIHDFVRSHACFADTLQYWRTYFRGVGGKSCPTAFVTYSARNAMPLMRAAELEGLHSPRDYSIATFDDTEMDYLGLPLCMCKLPWDRIGAKGVQLLLAKIEKREKSMLSEAVKLEWIPGSSTGPVPINRRDPACF
ncbi:hypothetical protein DB346_00980 [Verrucomicrobia bacterium LW23]|nr:hypothetical protein DB346_00980 [Verrucomicrobia bacterium LW23]